MVSANTWNGMFLSPALYSSNDKSLFFSGKKLLSSGLAKMTKISSPLYGLKVLTNTYSILGPTAKAVLDGSVHGVVVHARK